MNIKIDKQKISNKYYSTLYFIHTNKILKKYNYQHIATMQFICFNDQPYMVCGIQEVLLVLKSFLKPNDLKSLKIKARKDGDIILKNEPVLTITGKYYLFCELENIIDSILARRSSVATNCWRMLQYISCKQLVYMSDRSDDYTLHPYDGYAAYVAGVRNFSNDSHIAFIDDKNVKVYGSMPHALIHQYKNNINLLLSHYLKEFDDVSLLVDFDNDIIKTLKSVDKKYIKYITSIRIDTSKNNIDASLKRKGYQGKQYLGVNPILIKLVRRWMDEHGFKHTRIVATSDNNLQKIKKFTKLKIPVDYYGIGSALTQLSLHFTADLVCLDGKKYAKKGRSLKSDQKLKLVTWKE